MLELRTRVATNDSEEFFSSVNYNYIDSPGDLGNCTVNTQICEILDTSKLCSN